MYDIWFMGFNAIVMFFIGYQIGSMRGYGQGIESAAKIWQDSFSRMSKAMFSAVQEREQ